MCVCADALCLLLRYWHEDSSESALGAVYYVCRAAWGKLLPPIAPLLTAPPTARDNNKLRT